MLSILRILSRVLLVVLSIAIGCVGCTRSNGKADKNAQRDTTESMVSVPGPPAQASETPVLRVEPARVQTLVDEAPPKSRNVAAQLAAAGKSAYLRPEPVRGMTVAEVSEAWGEPLDIVAEEVVEGVVSTWHYEGNRKVKFDTGGIVTEVIR